MRDQIRPVVAQYSYRTTQRKTIVNIGVYPLFYTARCSTLLGSFFESQTFPVSWRYRKPHIALATVSDRLLWLSRHRK